MLIDTRHWLDIYTLKINQKTVMKQLLILLAIVFCAIQVHAQQESNYTQFVNSIQNYNPAFVGIYKNKSLSSTYRNQWIGVEGAPETMSLSYNGTTSKRGLAIGLGVINDKIGPSNETHINIDASYTIKISKESSLAFGLRGVLNMFNVNYNLLNQGTNYGFDPLLINNIENQFTPNVGVGLFYYNENFFTGLSVPNMLKTNVIGETNVSATNQRAHYYLTSGFISKISENVLMRPSFIISAVSGSPAQANLNLSFLMLQKLSLGASYRLRANLSAHLSYQISKPFMVGLSYDKNTSDLGEIIMGSGSIEVSMRYIFNTKNALKRPRFLF